MIVPTWLIASYLSPVKSKCAPQFWNIFSLVFVNNSKVTDIWVSLQLFFSIVMAMIFFLYSFENSLMNTSEMSLFLVRMVYIAKPNPNTYLPAIEIIALLE